MSRRDRLNKQIEDASERWQRLSTLLEKLQRDHDLETRSDERLRLDARIEQNEAQRNKIAADLSALEEQVADLEPGSASAKDGSALNLRGITTRASVRKLLGAVLKTATDFDRFCLDYFPEVHRRLAASMERPQRESLLLELVGTSDIIQRLAHEPDFGRHAQMLQLEPGDQS